MSRSLSGSAFTFLVLRDHYEMALECQSRRLDSGAVFVLFGSPFRWVGFVHGQGDGTGFEERRGSPW